MRSIMPSRFTRGCVRWTLAVLSGGIGTLTLVALIQSAMWQTEHTDLGSALLMDVLALALMVAPMLAIAYSLCTREDYLAIELLSFIAGFCVLCALTSVRRQSGLEGWITRHDQTLGYPEWELLSLAVFVGEVLLARMVYRWCKRLGHRYLAEKPSSTPARLA